MSSDRVQKLLDDANALTLAELLFVARELLKRSQQPRSAQSKLRWRDIRGKAKPGLVDAQEWITSERREAEESRNRNVA
jgi:16S rRNA C1402 (ribose-2'-O) methylase RsmI